ncbi:MAG: cytochrome c [Candidatus Acidiferrum sp.]
MQGLIILRNLGNLLILCLLSVLVVAPCYGQEKQSQKAPEGSSTLSAGAAQFTQHCAVCHGDDLKGSGPFPAPYRVPPDLTTLSRRHGGKFPEAYVRKVLRNGVTLPAHGPAEMPVWADTNRLDKAQRAAWIRDLTSYIKSRQAK